MARQIISGVYSITNTANDSRYIGSSIDLYRRWTTHKRDLRKGIHGNQILQRAWNKYGESSFEFTILLVCTKDDTLLHEQRYLDEEKPEYNICVNVRGTMTGRTMAEEQRRKIGDANRGHVMSDEQKLKLSEAHKGKKHTEEWKENMRGNKASLGYKFTDEQKEHLRQSHLGYKQTDEQKEHSRQAHIGKIFTEEHCKNISLSHIGKVVSEETREKLRVAFTGCTRTFTEEHKEHLREAWDRRRNGSVT